MGYLRVNYVCHALNYTVHARCIVFAATPEAKQSPETTSELAQCLRVRFVKQIHVLSLYNNRELSIDALLALYFIKQFA